jgi:hypothetical protein
MTDEQEKEQFDPENYPALLEFLPAYLHEDFVEEYGTAAKAMGALVADASGDQIRNVRDEWQALRQAFANKSLDDLHHALAELGVAWQPQSADELRGVDEILNHASI